MTETFRAEPLRTENSWRVVGSLGSIKAYRVPQKEAEALAAALTDSKRSQDSVAHGTAS